MEKILYITKEYPPYVYGGAGIHLANLTEHLLEICPALHMDVIYRGKKSYTSGERLTVTSIPNNLLDNFNNETEFMSGMLDWCKDIITKNRNFDLIHCHTWSTLLPGVLLKLLSRKPLIITCHSLDIERPWKQEVVANIYFFSTWIEKMAYLEADAIIAVSNSVKTSLSNRLGINSKKIHVIYNGADHYSQKSNLTLSELGLEIDNQIPYALFIGRLTRQKGLVYLLNAIERIDYNIQFVICAGTADSTVIEKEYLNRINSLKLSGKKIILVQNVYDKQIISCLYENAQIFINPSIYEPFGLTIAEALSHGLPIVASKIGGPSEILKENYNSILVEINYDNKKGHFEIDDEQYTLELTNAIVSMIKDDSLRARLKANAIHTFEQLPTWNQIAKRHLSIYNSVIVNT